ncbi:MAG: MFS transporter [Dehalococcoidia bacterium]
MKILETIKAKRHYGWVIFALTIINLSIEGGMSKGEGVFQKALSDPKAGFGRGAAVTSMVFSASGLVGFLASPFLGRILDRMGPRFLFTVAAFFLLIGLVGSSLVSNLWFLFITYSLIATLGQNSIGSFAATANLAPWFPRNRGRALGFADMGNPLGAFIFVFVSQKLVSSIGWRGSYGVLGLLFFMMVAPANFWLQRRAPRPTVNGGGGLEDSPAISGSETGDATSQAPSDASGPAPLTTQQLLGMPALWLLFLTRSLVTMGGQMTEIHLISFFTFTGYGDLRAASTISLVALLSIGGRPLIASISDRWGREAAFTLGVALHLTSLLVALQFADGVSLWPLALFVVFAGISDGFSGLLVGTKAADIFPANSLGTVMGIVEMGRGAGRAVGPFLGGLLFDLSGNYQPTFVVAGILLLASMCTMWLINLKRPALQPV